MSWLFDRLCEIAVADEIEIVISTQVGGQRWIGDSHELAAVLGRAAEVPQLTVSILPGDVAPTVVTGRRIHSIDLDDLDHTRAIELVAAMVRQHQRQADAALEVRGRVAALSTIGSDAAAPFDARGCRVVYITDTPGMGEHLAAAGRRGLGIAVGGVDPQAQIRVDHAVGAVSIVDALVALRMFAFGGDHDGEHLAANAVDARRRCGQAELSAIAM